MLSQARKCLAFLIRGVNTRGVNAQRAYERNVKSEDAKEQTKVIALRHLGVDKDVTWLNISKENALHLRP